ncbi:isoleucine--tRNA ligase [Mesoterricola sediminis]|uniref:Isoleucine--tRNA ligase n=1 Tax=Mesoterricola sediminis TaxID=2927980 RepID=A0AA48KDS7_9BACT|nr:isoleucine--tRNA ligase [Mesoterricola sediminis]BDU76642.1 isoleucine--tRNA ligase [Mesoterricola sediminis]
MADSTRKRYPVFLPRTDFPMKADLPQREPKRIERWKAEGLYARIEARKRADNAAGRGRGRRILHDGPPYANGAIHIGHALNKILKDMVVKSLWLDGYESPYVPGWDCHGLPIEHAVERDLGPKRREMSRSEFLSRCRAYAQKWIDSQRAGFQRLGVLGAWDEPYITMNPRYEADVVRLLGRLFECGAVTRKLKVVHWSYGARTALAEAEVEYADKTSPAITVAFPVADAEAKRMGLPTPLFLPIWTTTPWTLPSNLAIAMHPDMEYAVVKSGDRHYIVAVALMEDFGKKLGAPLHTMETRKGKEFQSLKARHCWLDRESPVLLADYVTADTGTGLVHTAPDHGVDDFNLAHHLGLLQLVGPDGRFTADVQDPELEGKNIFDTNPLVVDRLRAGGALLHEESLTHSYPHCWRTKTPIFFRATEQWFIIMDNELLGKGRSLRELGLDGVDGTRWVPAQGRNRIHAMISGRPDWCISRQRAWGTPLTVLRCTECGEPLAAREIFEKAAEAIERGGVEAWADLPLEQLRPAGAACAKCGSGSFQKETDILDVWIDSGVSAAVVCDTHSELSREDYGKFIYLEGSDQHRGWFHSSLLFNLAATGEKPYDTVVTHGFVLDGKGQKMSKSLGNVVVPEEVMKTLGADILRWWTASVDYNEDVRISKEILERSADAYRKIRNTLRFLLGALADFDPARDAVAESAYAPLDAWVLGAFGDMAGRVAEAYRTFNFMEAAQTLHGFCQLELSGRYFEIIKDRLYCDTGDSARRRSCRTACWRLAQGLAIMLAPVLSFTADEVWENIPGAEGSVFEQRFPEPAPHPAAGDWDRFWEIREAVQAAMEPHRAAKTIGTSLDAAVTLALPAADAALLGRLGEDPEDLLVVSGLTVTEAPDLEVAVAAHAGTKCPRCWNHKGGAGEGEDADLCPRCDAAVKAQA